MNCYIWFTFPSCKLLYRKLLEKYADLTYGIISPFVYIAYRVTPREFRVAKSADSPSHLLMIFKYT